MNTAKEMMDHLAGFAKRTFEDHGEIIPMWVIIGKNDDIVPILSPFSSDEEKDATAEFIRSKAKEMDAKPVGFMCEAWVVEAKAGTKIDCQPSQHTDRREVIQIYAEDKPGSLFGTYYILRPEHGKAKLSPFKVFDGDASGRFTSILEKA